MSSPASGKFEFRFDFVEESVPVPAPASRLPSKLLVASLVALLAVAFVLEFAVFVAAEFLSILEAEFVPQPVSKLTANRAVNKIALVALFVKLHLLLYPSLDSFLY